MRTTLPLAIAVLSMLLSGSAGAQDSPLIDEKDVEVADVLVCDTQEQVEQYIMAYNGDRDAAIGMVNRESGPPGCGVVSAAFVRGPEVGSASHGNMAFKILRVLVLGVEVKTGFHAVEPTLYFSAFGVTEYPV